MNEDMQNEIKEYLEIDETRLEEELLKQPSRYFYWGGQWASALYQYSRIKTKVKETEARLCNNFREQYTKLNPGVRVTEAMLREYLQQHPEWLAIIEEETGTESIVNILEVAKDAFKQRHYSLLELYRNRESMKLYADEAQIMEQDFEKRLEQEKTKKGKRRKINDTE